MGFFSRTKKVASLFVNWRVDKMMNIKSIHDNATYFYTTFLSLFRHEYPKMEESFEEAVERLELTPEKLERKASQFLLFTFLFIFISILLFLYSLFMFANGNWMGSIMSFFMIFYSLSQAFRYHFWHFQIKNKKLGCTLREWLKNRVQKDSLQIEYSGEKGKNPP